MKVAAISGQGGWPLTAFLTPDGDVFFGGTYFPPDEGKPGRPGFATVLRHVARLFREDPAKVRGNAQAIREHLGAALDERAAEPAEDLVPSRRAAMELRQIRSMRLRQRPAVQDPERDNPRRPHR